jgi:two-component sensor histidine kinase
VHQPIINLDKAIPCGIIINELMSNSFKYAFADASQGVIHVELKQNEKNDYVLCVSDNGKGLPDGLDIITTPTLGLQLVNSLVGQLEGELEIDLTKGTSFIITFK